MRELRAPLCVGAVLRLVAAFGAGLFASDDYLYVLEPAYRWLEEPGAPYPSPIRSPLLAWFAHGCMRIAALLVGDDPAWLVRAVYLGLGLWSLFAIPAAYVLARDAFGAHAGRYAAWLLAAHALLPRLSTRALIEVACIPPLLLGLTLATRALSRREHATKLLAFAGACLGLASLLRFQVGLVLVTVFVLLIVRKIDWRGLAAFSAAAVVSCGLDILIAWHTHGGFTPLPLRYLAWNLEHSHKFGGAPWFTYLVFFLLLTLPPITLVLAKPLARAGRGLPIVGVSLLVFVLVHSLVGHKEERFMFPALPLFLVLLAAALAELSERDAWAARLARRAFLAVNAVALVLVTLSNGQQSLITPLIDAARSETIERVIHLRHKSPKAPALYVGHRRALVEATSEASALATAREHAGTRFLFPRPPSPNFADEVRALGYACATLQTYEGDLIDRLLLAVRPRQNKRRAATYTLDCTPESKQDNALRQRAGR